MNSPEPGYSGIEYPLKIKKQHGHDINLVGKTKRFKSRDKPFIIGISLASIFLVLFTLLVYYIYSEKDKVVKGTHLEYGEMFSEEIGGLNYQIAQNLLKKDMEKLTDTKIALMFGSDIVEAKFADLGVKLDYASALKQIKKSTYGPYIYDSVSKHFAAGTIVDAAPGISLDKAILNKYIDLHFKGIDITPQNAEMYIENNVIKIKKESSGRILDRHKLSDSIVGAFKNKISSVVMPVSNKSAEITEVNLKGQIPEKIISSFKTRFKSSDSNRKTNIRLGASFINNIILKPGEEFEFWRYVGNPTSQRGFHPAGVYLNGSITTGVGGGLCQVSTTLYNAALLADLKITRRQPHGLPVHYVPLGLDATVDYSSLTFKFVNNTGKYLLIKSSTDNDILKFDILGYMPAGKTVKVYTKSAGYNAADAYREVYVNGSLARKDYLGRSKYKSLK